MSDKPEWWETFFSGLFLDIQRECKTDEETAAEVDFIEKVIGLSPGASILDVPCGVGRHSIELASRGYRLTGVDITESHLEEASRRADERNVSVTWEHRDMRDLPWAGEFDAAMCFWGSFGYFDENEDARFAGAVSRTLKPDGAFLLDTHAAETLLPIYKKRGWSRMGDAIVLEERQYDCERSRINVEWTLVHKSGIENTYSSMRIYTYRELCNLLGDAGFARFEGYNTVTGEPFEVGSKRLCLVARKKA